MADIMKAVYSVTLCLSFNNDTSGNALI